MNPPNAVRLFTFNMRLGVSTYTFTWAIGVPGSPPAQPMTALDLLQRAHDLGVSLVQIVDNLPPHKLTSTELDALASRAQNLNIAFEVGTRGLERDHLLTYLDLAERLGSPIVRTIATGVDVAEVVSLLKPVIPAFESRNITLAIENHDRLPAHDLREIIERLDSTHVGICLDTVNSFGALEGPAVVVATLAPYVVNLHIKDFVIFRASHMMGFTLEGTPAGQGRLDVPWLLNQLSGRTFNAILELWTPPAADLAATIAKENDWAAQSIPYLRQFIPT